MILTDDQLAEILKEQTKQKSYLDQIAQKARGKATPDSQCDSDCWRKHPNCLLLALLETIASLKGNGIHHDQSATR